uniref:G-patch domain and KOW motifs-containing protein isoform X2 n=1 Tax=Myxine glutinosa TaxID=7769 RepID=UPI00358E12C1
MLRALLRPYHLTHLSFLLSPTSEDLALGQRERRERCWLRSCGPALSLLAAWIDTPYGPQCLWPPTMDRSSFAAKHHPWMDLWVNVAPMPYSTKPKELYKELVIPLIKQNRWETLKGKKLLPEQKPNDAEFEAIKEVLEDSRRFLEKQEQRDIHAMDETFAIPMLLQNKVPDGFEDGGKVDVSLRPDVATEADYAAIPVEAYGLAMIRGMGWKPGEGIGKTFKQEVKVMEHQLRPKGLGLGADRSALEALEGKKPARPLKPGEQRAAEEPLGHVPGGHVLLESGPHKGLCGKIEAVDADNARLVVRLALGGNAMTVSQYVARPVSSKEYDKLRQGSSTNKGGNKDEEVGKAKRRKQEQKGDGGGWQERHLDRQETVGMEFDMRSQDGKRHGTKKKHDVLVEKRKNTVPVMPESSCWLHRDLRVRFIDRSYKGGKYYNCKVTIEDVVTADKCDCRTDEGRLLEGITEVMVETIVPKNDTESILVVLGKFKGEVPRDRCSCLCSTRESNMSPSILPRP